MNILSSCFNINTPEKCPAFLSLAVLVVFIHSLADVHFFHAVGENVKEFFFRVASLAFETNVLAELEKSGSRQIGDVVSEYSHILSVTREATAMFVAHFNARLCVCFRN